MMIFIWLLYERGGAEMAGIGENVETFMDLQPEAWRYKTGSGYSVTEGMEYELFTEEFQRMYREMTDREQQYTETIKNNIFLESMTLHSGEQQIREKLFMETKRENRRESMDVETSPQEFLAGAGFIVLLFCLLVSLTFRKKKQTHKKQKQDT
ncbi:MAG: hypothetical protein NC318_13900 [Blautia sp.]|nr:hypothetical protein [Lachnoclostridium sp.]MCM1212681.1 hypothetical protein [Blautia sp.]